MFGVRLAEEIREFAERFLRGWRRELNKKNKGKIEFTREFEKKRVEMENKRRFTEEDC